MTRLRAAAVLAACSIAVASCATGAGLQPPDATTPVPPTTAATTTSTTTTTIPRDCTPRLEPLPAASDGLGPAAVSVLLSEATFPCADEVTVASTADPAAAARAALHAAGAGGPLLLFEGPAGPLLEEITRLGPRVVTVAGGVDPAGLAGWETRPLPDGLEIRGGIVQGGPGAARLFVVGPQGRAAWPAVWAAARAAGDTAVLVPGDDLRAAPAAYLAAVRSAPEAAVALLGAGEAAWQVPVVRSGTELPGGGLLLFPGRRLVAFYGQPETSVLGVLGEQGVAGAAATIERLAPIVASYQDGSLPAMPAFEIIATVASADPTSDGDYSYETPVETLRPWIEAAGEQGVYVILDLQPGRTDFLTQAQIYEEFVRLPHVGIAIDPEWRLEPDQFHLRQIGSVDAAEINAVAEWMAAIVREEALPQKLLLLHQFRFDMIPDRADVVLLPELAVVVQMDGQGPLPTKYGTWSALTTAPDAGRFWWGWKNFYDEDTPMATPQEVFDLAPTVVYVSFQ